MPDVATVAMDPGVTRSILLIDEALRKLWLPGRKLTVQLVGNGYASGFLHGLNRPFIDENDPQRVTSRFDGYPKVFVTSMCSLGGVGRNLIPLMRAHSVPTVAVQDQWGAHLLTAWRDEQYRPDYIVVNDRVAADIVKRAWPKYSRKRIKILGYAILDELAKYSRAAIEWSERGKYGLNRNLPVLYFSGQLGETDVALDNLVAAIVAADEEVQLILGMHPGLKNEERMRAYPGLAERVAQAVERAREKVGRVVDRVGDEVYAVAAADVTIGMYPTAFTEAVAFRRPAIADFAWRAGASSYEKATGGLMRVHPLVELGAVRQVTNRRQYVSALRGVSNERLAKQLLPFQEKAFRVRSGNGNAEDIAKFCASLM